MQDLNGERIAERAKHDLVGQARRRGLGGALHCGVGIERKLVHRDQELRGTHGRHPTHRHQLGGRCTGGQRCHSLGQGRPVEGPEFHFFHGTVLEPRWLSLTMLA